MARSRKKPQNSNTPAPRRPARHQAPTRANDPRGKDKRSGSTHTDTGIKLSRKDSFFLFGRNSVLAALENPARECIRLLGTDKALSDKAMRNLRPDLRIETVDDPRLIAASVPEGAPHQGILLEVRALGSPHLEELTPTHGEKNIILMLDQVTDPHNVGACIRSAAAFGARAMITQDRNSPSESGTLARSAAGGLEILPWLKVPNLSATLEKLRDMGYWHVGLDGNTEQALRDISLGDNLVIVMGSEGSGLRPLVRKNCDAIAKIPMSGKVESLNVSNAAAIALYELSGT